MSQNPTEFFSLDASTTVTLYELAECCGLSAAELDELVDYNALVPLTSAPERAFSAQWVVPLRKAAKMRVDFDLDVFTVAILLGQLIQIELLERQVQSLQALVPANVRQA
ncbi:MAG: chaperone modulator CbpM [Rhodoferax sp.]|uniref:chaperone modulator CbpM n=1 Tax=Rhodoferax sp. TaxID=50421 RepID=UPI002609C46C|nr:chaperone modulator CbpM [Rhodoferax sp.]MDD2881048.1 chaperone modulator CbpM [Rhodoferax sp.]